jgi:hypothetical protein
MKKEDLCRDDKTIIWEKLQPGQDVEFTGTVFNLRPLGIKRKRMVCSKCKRRLWSSVELHHDGRDIIHTIPPHKPKKWWKKKNKEKKR